MNALRWNASVARRALRALAWPIVLLAVLIYLAMGFFKDRWGPAMALIAIAFSVVVHVAPVLSKNRRGKPISASVGRIETERLTLRSPRMRDAGGYERVLDEESLEVNGWTPEAARDSVRLVRRSPGLYPGWMFERKIERDIAGTVSIRRDATDGCVEIGWMVAPHARRQGYGTEAVGAVIAALHARGIDVVRAGTAIDNTASRRILDRVGARPVREGPHTLPDGTTVDGVWYEHRDD